MDEEQWLIIEDFPTYEISSRGQIYNHRTRQLMRTSVNNYGHVKITLKARHTQGRCDFCGAFVDIRVSKLGEKPCPIRHTLSVALLVATAFVDRPTPLCDQLVILDGDFRNVSAYNLAWRPRTFAWKYTRQLKVDQPLHYLNLPVCNVISGNEYECIVHAGITEGLLFSDVWRSTYTGAAIFPNGSVFEVIERV